MAVLPLYWITHWRIDNSLKNCDDADIGLRVAGQPRKVLYDEVKPAALNLTSPFLKGPAQRASRQFLNFKFAAVYTYVSRAPGPEDL